MNNNDKYPIGIEQGRFVVIEGIDGSGKDTISDKLFKTVKNIYTDVYYSTMDKGKYYTDIKEHVDTGNIDNTELAMLHISNITSIDKKIKELLNEDMLVISNRWYYSTLVYNTLDEKEYEWVLNNCTDITRPGLVILLDIEPSVAYERIVKNRAKVDFFESLEKLNRYRKKYLELANRYQEFVIINANREPDVIVNDILNIFKEKI